jgi:hypothetical protein
MSANPTFYINATVSLLLVLWCLLRS